QYFFNLGRITAPGDTESRNVHASRVDQGQGFSPAKGGQFVIRDDDIPGVLLQSASQVGGVVNPSGLRRKTTTPEMPEDQFTVIPIVVNHERAQGAAFPGWG